MVEAGGDRDLVIPLDRGTLGSLNRDGDLAGGTDGEDGGLRGVDDSSEVVDGVVHTHVGDGDGATLVLLGLQLAVTGLLSQRLHLGGDRLEAARIGTGNNGSDQTVGGGDSDGDVDAVELADEVALPRRVGSGDLLRGDSDGLNQEVVDRDLELAVGASVEGFTELEQLADGELAGHEEVRVVLGGLLEALGNGLAHVGERDVLVRGSGGGSSGSATGGSSSSLLGFLGLALQGGLEAAFGGVLLGGGRRGG